MLKRTLVFSNPGYLSTKQEQLVFKPVEGEEHTFPIEDLGFVILEERSLTCSTTLLSKLSESGCAVVICNQSFMPQSMLLSFEGNHLQTEIYGKQIQASIPLKKNLWKQTVEAKIQNQAALLEKIGREPAPIKNLKQNVKSGDPDNKEAQAARLYWPRLFNDKDFRRDPEGPFPNNALNYGYAILRSAVARALVGSGLLLTIGIHHHNRYNPFCLADDIMEPFRPYVDEIVYNMYIENNKIEDLNKISKKK
jgi:CRISPR-associated protein Cas1